MIETKKIYPNDDIKRVPQTRKIKIPRWFTKTIAEYDVDNKYWMTTECNTSLPFFPFSSFVYLPNKDIIVIGGFNDNIPNRATFSSKVLKIVEKPINFLESSFECVELEPLKIKRGCSAATYTDGHVYVMGGQNHQDKVLKKCERYNVALNKWEVIPSMEFKRKNPSAVAFNNNDIYIFGGCLMEDSSSDTIECYNIKQGHW